MSTKDKILEAALKLFNKQGFRNVNLRQIAQEVGLSIGNLAYHYKNKEMMIEAIHQQIIQERTALFAQVQFIPSIANIHQQLIPLLHLYKKYRFFYVDILEIVRALPAIAALHQQHVANQITYIKVIIDYSVGSGNMQAEPKEGYYEDMAHTVWMLISFWLHQGMVRGNEGNYYDDARKAIWNQVYPHMTEKGQHNMQQITSEFKSVSSELLETTTII